MLEARTTPEGSQSEPAVRGGGVGGGVGGGEGEIWPMGGGEESDQSVLWIGVGSVGCGQWGLRKYVANQRSGTEWDLLAMANSRLVVG